MGNIHTVGPNQALIVSGRRREEHLVQTVARRMCVCVCVKWEEL